MAESLTEQSRWEGKRGEESREGQSRERHREGQHLSSAVEIADVFDRWGYVSASPSVCLPVCLQ